MDRTYNHKISERANENLRKRARTLQLRRQVAVLSGIIVLSLTILLCSSISAFASAQSKETLHKYYTSIQVKDKDTLWDLADNYVTDGVMSKSEFIEEVCQINNLSDGQIHRGENIIVTYYSTEIK